MRRILLCAIVISLGTACQREAESYRGAGMSAAKLAPAEAAAAYRAALGGAFDLRDPALSILVDTLLLPRTPGLDGGARIDDGVLAAMRDAGVVKGVCGRRAAALRARLSARAPRGGVAGRARRAHAEAVSPAAPRRTDVG